MKKLLLLTSPVWFALAFVGVLHLIWPFLGPDARAGAIELMKNIAGIFAIAGLIPIVLWLFPGILYGMVGGSPAGGFWLGVLGRWWRRR
jgi:hypothetical protein